MALPTERAKLCYDKKVKSDVFLAKFTNGKLVADQAKDVRFACYQYDGMERRHKMTQTLVCETEQLQYIGHNKPSDASEKSSKCRYLVAAYNKRRGKVRLYDSNVFKMQPNFPEEEDKEDKTDMTIGEKVNELTSVFGAKRKRRAMETRIRNKIQGEALNAAMSDVVDDVLSKPEAAKMTSTYAGAKGYTTNPPYDAEATEPSGIYSLDSIIDAVVLEALKGPAQALLDSRQEDIDKWRLEDKYGEYILDHLTMLPINPESRSKTVCCLMYLHYMMAMFQLKAELIKEKIEDWSELPRVVEKSLTSQFTIEATVPNRVKPRIFIPSRQKDKLLAYICVLCLIIDEYSFEYRHLAKDLHIPLIRVRKTLQSLGCKIKDQLVQTSMGVPTKVGFASLKVPFKIPSFVAMVQH